MSRTICWLLAACLLIFGQGALLAQTEATEEPEEDPCAIPLIDDPAPSYYVGLGDVQFGRKNFAASVVHYTCAIDRQPDYAPTYASRGFAYAALGDSDSALADYDRALELDETLLAAYTNRGTLYARLGNFGLAIGDFTLVISLDPDNAVAYNNRGIIHAVEGNYDLAIADFQEAIGIDSRYTMPHASLAAVYSALAAQSYQRYVEVTGLPNPVLPAGTPEQVITALDGSLRNGDFSVWLPLLSPAP